MKNTKSEHILTKDDAALLYHLLALYRNKVQSAKDRELIDEEGYTEELQTITRLQRFVDNYTL